MEKDLASKSKVNVIDISDSESDASDSEGVLVLEDGEGVLFNVCCCGILDPTSPYPEIPKPDLCTIFCITHCFFYITTCFFIL